MLRLLHGFFRHAGIRRLLVQRGHRHGIRCVDERIPLPRRRLRPKKAQKVVQQGRRNVGVHVDVHVERVLIVRGKLLQTGQNALQQNILVFVDPMRETAGRSTRERRFSLHLRLRLDERPDNETL